MNFSVKSQKRTLKCYEKLKKLCTWLGCGIEELLNEPAEDSQINSDGATRMNDANVKRTSFDLTIENSAALKRISESTGENYSAIINNMIAILAGDDNEILKETLKSSIEKSYRELLDKASKETDMDKVMKEYGSAMRKLETLKGLLA